MICLSTCSNNLRLVRAGASDTDFKLRFGVGLRNAYGAEVDDLIRLGLLEENGDAIRLTGRGRLLGNQVFLRFVE